MVKNKFKKLNKKGAMSLVALLFSLALLSILVGMFIPVLTKGYIQITTGKGGFGKINLTKSNGFFMCYYEANGVLTQARADISHTGEVKLVKEPAPEGGCRFVIPTRQESFKITLIGGGGGGAASGISSIDENLGTVNLYNGTSGKITIPAFTDWLPHISAAKINSALAALFSNNTGSSNAYICLTGNNGANLGAANGAGGAKCMVRFTTMPQVGDSFTISQAASASPTVYAPGFKLSFKDSTATAFGGANAVAINGVNSSPEQYITSCCGGSITGCPEAFKVLCDKISNDASGVGECKAAGSNFSVVKGGSCTAGGNGINFVNVGGSYYLGLNSAINLNLRRRGFITYNAGSGESGAVETRTVSFITPNNGADTFQIPAEWLGNGGIGGGQPGNAAAAGTAGTATRIELAAAGAAEPVTYTAAGGAGGSRQENPQRVSVVTGDNPDDTPDVVPAAMVPGADGKFPRDIIPQPLRITMLSPGLGVVDCKDGSCDVAAAATYPGAGGGAAGAYYSGYNRGAAPRIIFERSNYTLASASSAAGALSNPDVPVLKNGRGGNGARGAILISW